MANDFPTPKYSRGDEVYYVSGGMIQRGRVSSIGVFSGPRMTEIRYSVEGHGRLLEGRLFASSRELIDFLIQKAREGWWDRNTETPGRVYDISLDYY